MALKKDPASLFFIILAFFIVVGKSFAESDAYISPEEEAPTTIFEFELGDSEVSLFAQGYWDLSLTGGIGFEYDSFSRTFTKAEFPGMPYGVVFEQSPDITISLWLLERIFLEATVIDDFQSSRFLLGYEGKPGEVVHSIYAGNSGTNFGTYGFVTLPNAASTSLGISSQLLSPISSHELMLRYDPAENVELLFRGNNQVIQQRIAATEFIKGRFFLLPDADIKDVVVYLEAYGGTKYGGDGRFYREARADEVTVYPEYGTIELSSSAAGRVLVYYRCSGYEVGDPQLGRDALLGTSAGKLDPTASPEDFNWSVEYLGDAMSSRRVEIGSDDCLLIYEPGHFSPFERYCFYSAATSLPEDQWKIRAYLVNTGASDGRKLDVSGFAAQDLIQLTGSDDSPRIPSGKYPLIENLPDLYDPEIVQAEPFEILLEILSPVDAISAGSDFVPGTITVLRDGRPAQDVTVGADGEISFSDDIEEYESITVKYRTNASSFKGGDILFGIGNRFFINDHFSVDAGMGLRWNVFSGEHTTEPATNEGLLIAGTGLQYSGEIVTAGIDGALSVYSPDTTGIFRAESMSGDAYSISLSGCPLYPSSVPASEVAGFEASELNRGVLLYKDYHDYTNDRYSYLRDYTWSPPSDQVYPYDGGSFPGPYIADGGDQLSETVAVLDFTLAPEEWVGGAIVLSSGDGTVDLSSFSSVDLTWMGLGLEEDVIIAVQIGAVGEDLDGDGILDAEDSEYSDGFTFEDPDVDGPLYIGGGTTSGGNGRIDGEDVDGNGILDTEDTSLVFTALFLPGQSDYPGDSWNRITIPLSLDDRHKLGESRAIRILAVNTSSSTGSSKLLIGNIEFRGSEFKLVPPAIGKATTREILESEMKISGDSETLYQSFPEVAETLAYEGESPQVLEIEWEDVDEDGFAMAKPITGVSLDSYRSVSMYYRGDDISGTNPRLCLGLFDGTGKGVEAAIPLSSGSWHKLTVEIEDGIVLIDGTQFTGTSLQLTDAEAVVRMIRLSISGTESGRCYIDEIHLHRTDLDVSGGGSAFIDVNLKDVRIEAGGLPMITGIRFRQELSGYASHFTGGTINYSGAPLVSSYTTGAAELTFLKFTAKFGTEWAGDEITFTGGHTVSGPTWFPPLTLGDSYEESEDEFSRSNTLSITAPGIIDFKAYGAASTYSGILDQSWDFRIDSDPPIPFKIGTNAAFGSSTSDYVPTGKNYFSRWAQGYLLLVPWTETEYPERKFEGASSLDISTEPIGLELEASAGYHTTGRQNRKREDSAAAGLSIPLVIPPDSDRTYRIRFDYERESSTISRITSGDSFGYDFTGLWNGIGSKKYLYTTIPFAEFFNQKTKEDFIKYSNYTLLSDSESVDAGTLDTYEYSFYQPKYSFEFFRPYGSSLIDLFLPASLRASIQRELELDGIDYTDTLEWKASARILALNMFGNAGRYRLFRFYRSDEFADMLTVSGEYERISGAKNYGVGLQDTFSFFGHQGTSIELSNQFHFEWESEIDESSEAVLDSMSRTLLEDLTAEVTWQRYLNRTIRIPFWEEEYNRFLFRNTETIGFSGSYPLDSDSGGSNTRLVTKHSTEFVIEGIGSIGAFFEIGFDWTTVVTDGADGYQFGIGLHGGIEGRFEF